MRLVYDSVNNYIIASSAEIAVMVNNPGDYTGATVRGSLNCTATPVIETIDIADLQVNTSHAYFLGDDLIIKPYFFGGTTVDGVYRVSITINTAQTGVMYTMCIFIDVTLKCKIAAIMKDIVEENAGAWQTEKKATIIHILHYSLVNGSNCGCNCNEMCTVYDELISILSNIDPTIIDCGCQ